MDSFFRFFAKRHTLANVFTIMVLLLGLNSFMTIRRAQFPTVDFGEMFIITSYPGAAPEDVELNVTNKIEDELKGISGIKRMVSISRENSSFIHILIDPDVKDTDSVKDDVREAVNRVTDFPVEVTESPFIKDLNTSIFPIIEVGLTSKVLPYAELREYARLFEKKLKNVKGVAGVERYGYLDREIKIEVSPEQIRNYQLSMKDIITSIKTRNIRAAGGSMESYTSEKNVVTMAQFRDPMEAGDVYVRSPVKVKDLAMVTSSFEDAKILSRVNGKPAISFVVSKSENADTIRTVNAIKELIKEEQKYLPDEVEIIYSNDISIFVKNQFDIMRNNGSIGLILVIILLAIFLNYRTSFWVALGIPVSIFGVVAILPIFDSFLNSSTLFSMIIIIGIVVDDGIIISENITMRRELGDTPLDAAVNGINEVFQPVITTILTTILAFAPMFFMKGMLGKFVFSIPLTVIIALCISFLEVVIALPAHMQPGLSRASVDFKCCRSREWFDPVKLRFKQYLYKLLNFRYIVVAASILILSGSLFYASYFMDFILFPSQGADRFFVVLELPVGSSLQATTDKTKLVEDIIRGLPEGELSSFITRIGAYGDDIVSFEGENFSMIMVALTPFSKRDRTADEIVEDLRRKVDNLGVFKKATFNIDTGGPPVGKPILIRAIGSDDGTRKKLAADLMAFLGTIDGVKDIEMSDKTGKQQVEINIDYYELARLDLTVSDVAQNVRTAYDGEVVTSIRYGDEDVDFRVQLTKDARKQLDYLYDLPIPNMQGDFIPLRHVAALNIGPGPAIFYHYDGERTINVTADVDQKKTSPTRVAQAVLKNFDLHKDYPGMRFIVGGEAQELQESVESLIRVFIVALIGIYLLLILLFDSATQPLMVITIIPFGIAGIILAFALHGMPFSFVSLIGGVGLAGVVVNDSLVLVSHINKKRLENPGTKIREIVCEGATDRLRAIIMTTLTTVAGLLPLAYGIGGMDVYMAPMAMAIGYGLLFATPITLILLPSLYVIGDDIKKKLKLKSIIRKG